MEVVLDRRTVLAVLPAILTTPAAAKSYEDFCSERWFAVWEQFAMVSAKMKVEIETGKVPYEEWKIMKRLAKRLGLCVDCNSD